MRYHVSARAWHILLVAGVLAGLVPAGSAEPVHAKARQATASTATGTDLPAQDTDTGRYTLQANGLTELQLYNSPVGMPDAAGWRFRDPRLTVTAGQGIAVPRRLPFDLRIATTSSTAPLARLANEDGTRLGIAFASAHGTAPAAVAGQIAGNAITYTAVVSPDALPTENLPPGGETTASIASSLRSRIPAGMARGIAPQHLSASAPCMVAACMHDLTVAPPATLPATDTAITSTATATGVTSATTTALPTSVVFATATASATSSVTASVTATAVASGTMPATSTVSATSTATATATSIVTATTTALVTSTATTTVPATPTATTRPATSTASATSTPEVTATTSPTATGTSTATATTTVAATSTASPAAVPAPLDLSLRATIGGLDVRLVLHNPGDAGPFVFSLAPDARARLVPEAGGAIGVIRPVAGHSDGGAPYVVDQPEYLLHAAAASDSNPDPAAQASPGSVRMTLVPASTGRAYLALSVDPAWLTDPHRVFPVRLDLPIVTAYAALHSGVSGTVSSCLPIGGSTTAGAVAGTEGACIYHGELRFDLASIMNDTPIVAATLRLYTPDRMGPTGVQVYPNTGGSAPPSWQSPSWDTVPALAGASGIAQSASGGHWQSWDVTGLVRTWVRDGKSNGGLTLAGAETAVTFAAPLGTGGDDPSLAPYLDIVYAPRPAISAAYYDGAQYVYGVAGTFAAASGAGYTAPCSTTAGVCTEPNGKGGLETDYEVSQVVAPDGASPNGPGAGYIRLGITLSCASATPGYAWWNSSDQNPYAAGPVAADHYNVGSVLDILRTVATIDNNAGNVDHLIPIVTVGFNPACTQYSTPGSWYSQLRDFVLTMNAYAYGAYRPIYFEIGNEVNFGANIGPMGGGPSGYSSIFAAAAQGVSVAMQSIAGWNAHYHTLTAGMLQPSVSDNAGICPTPQSNIVDVAEAWQAINAARQKLQSLGLPVALGVAVHPYAYTTANTFYWRNVRYYGLPYNGVCFDLTSMIGLWVNTYFPGLPVVFSEINVDSHACAAGTSGCTLTCRNPAGVDGDPVANCEGAYLADLYTYLFDRPASGSGSYADAGNSPLRVAWFRGNDAGDNLGLAYNGGSVKPATIRGIEDPYGVPYCTNSPVVGIRTMPHDYYWLRFGACY